MEAEITVTETVKHWEAYKLI